MDTPTLVKERRIKQKLFDHVVVNMLLQGKPGSDGEVALLRMPDGTKCSLGFLIADKFYKPEFESRPPNEVSIDILEMPSLGWQFYDDLQEAHDRSANAANWGEAFHREMKIVAQKHFLDPKRLSP